MKVKFRRHPDGWAADVRLAGQDGSCALSGGALGWSPAEALTAAASLVEKMTSDPIVMALLPPQATAAIKAAQLIGAASASGIPDAMSRVLQRFRGPGARRLARTLSRLEREREHRSAR